MSTPGLFVVGVLVTLIVTAALALLSYAAILDSRYATAQKPVDEGQLLPEAERDPMVAA